MDDNYSLYYDMKFRNIEDRIELLEKKAFKTSKKDISTRAQQILILHHLGFLDKVKELGLNNTKAAKLLSVLLNASDENIRHDLSIVNEKTSELTNELNYKFLVELFGGLKLVEHENEMQKILTRIQDKNEKITKK